MKLYLTIDGGTTNTRINLVRDGKLCDTVKNSVGAGKAKDDKELYVGAIREGIAEILSRNYLTEQDITAIIASGMITSEYGLCNLEHISVPAGLCELHESMYKCDIPQISSIPVVFIRGVKCCGESFADTDIMRGEETELMGIIDKAYGKCVYVLPGSHSKIIKTDEKGRIWDFSTMLTGEMTYVLSQNTILKDAVDLSISDFDEKMLLCGFDTCKHEGINKALFKVRILKNIFSASAVECYSFFMGVVLCDELVSIINSDAENVVLAGKAQLKNAMAYILQNRCNKKVVTVDDSTVNASTAVGAVRIFESAL